MSVFRVRYLHNASKLSPIFPLDILKIKYICEKGLGLLHRQPAFILFIVLCVKLLDVNHALATSIQTRALHLLFVIFKDYT